MYRLAPESLMDNNHEDWNWFISPDFRQIMLLLIRVLVASFFICSNSLKEL